MLSTLIITPDNRATFQKIISDLKYAISKMDKDEMFAILTDSAIASGIATVKTKYNALKNFGKFAISTAKRYRDNGLLNSAKDDADKAKHFFMALPENTKTLYNKFIQLSNSEKTEVIIVTILTSAIFFSAGGGLDMEGGLPDSDIAIAGIGNHRNIISHSLLIGFGIEFSGRFCINILKKVKGRMPEDRHPVWDKIYYYIEKHQNLAIAAMWMGVGVHLLKDTGILIGGMKPYTGLPHGLPIEVHEGILGANGAASILFGNYSMKKG